MRALRWCVTVAFIMVLARPGGAQTVTAALTGTVIDSSAAVVAGISVTARNVSTNLTFTTRTNAAGVYDLLFLPIGS
jgi:hypothetical protein